MKTKVEAPKHRDPAGALGRPSTAHPLIAGGLSLGTYRFSLVLLAIYSLLYPVFRKPAAIPLIVAPIT
jgi:hypothetical protein